MYDVEVTLSLQMAAYCSVLHPTVHMLPQCYTLQECGTKQHTPPPPKKMSMLCAHATHFLCLTVQTFAES